MRRRIPREAFRLSAFDGRYYIVHISSTPGAMRRAMRAAGIAPIPPKLVACCIQMRSKAEPYLRGTVFVPRSRIGCGLVTHELAHAAFRLSEEGGRKVRHWARRRRHWAQQTSEERYCLLLEHLVREFWVNAYERGFA